MAVFFANELEPVATYWRIFRRDGIAMGFSSHNKALWFGGIRHRGAPGMVPSAIRRTTDVGADSAEVSGALSHDSIREADLAAGLFDGAQIEIGAVNWETLEHDAVYSGSIGQVEHGNRGFNVELRSAKTLLDRDLVPRTSPTCRAVFCGKECALSAPKFIHRKHVDTIDYADNSVRCAGIDSSRFVDGVLRFLQGPQTGVPFSIVFAEDETLFLDRPIAPDTRAGSPVNLQEGCDHTLATCHSRFDNAVNFRGEPFLPGNDLLTRYPVPPR